MSESLHKADKAIQKRGTELLETIVECGRILDEQAMKHQPKYGICYILNKDGTADRYLYGDGILIRDAKERT